MSQSPARLPPGQQIVAPGKWPLVGERSPAFRSGDWTIDVAGLVEHPLRLTLQALRMLPTQQQVIDIHCVTRWSKPAVTFGGVLLRHVLARAAPTSDARFVSFVAHSQRQHSTSLPVADALELSTMLAMEADGSALPHEHGGPVRVVVPDRYFYKSLKWLARIELLAEDRLGYWESVAGYHNVADPWREQRYVADGMTKQQAAQLLATRDLRNQPWLNLSMAQCELAGLRAEGALLRNADFRGCDLQAARFDEANLSNAHFQAARLAQASFVQADLEGANFAGADLRGANLLAASIVAATFVEANARAQFDQNTLFSRALLEQLTPDQQAYVIRQVTTFVEDRAC